MFIIIIMIITPVRHLRIITVYLSFSTSFCVCQLLFVCVLHTVLCCLPLHRLSEFVFIKIPFCSLKPFWTLPHHLLRVTCIVLVCWHVLLSDRLFTVLNNTEVWFKMSIIMCYSLSKIQDILNAFHCSQLSFDLKYCVCVKGRTHGHVEQHNIIDWTNVLIPADFFYYYYYYYTGLCRSFLYECVWITNH